jgi:WD40 repeat protein
VAAADESGTVVLYAARTGRVERTLHPKGITGFAAAAYAPNGTLATGTWSGIVQLWNPGTGREIGKPTLVAAAPVASIAFGPTGSSFATAGASDGFAKLWTTGTLRQFGSALPGPLGPWGHAQFTPDGTRLVVVWDDGTGTVWPASVEAWQQHACAVAGRNFTREEWLQYVGNAAAYRPTCQPPVSVP